MNRCIIKFDGENSVLIIELQYMHKLIKMFNFFYLRCYFSFYFMSELAKEFYILKKTKIYEVFT